MAILNNEVKLPDRNFLSDVDDDLGELLPIAEETKIVFMPCEPEWAYAYWHISEETKAKFRQRGGTNLFLRLSEVKNESTNYRPTTPNLEYICNETAHDWYIPVPHSDRTYTIEIGYRCLDGKWLSIAVSEPTHIPPLYPSDYKEDIFVSVPWTKNLTGEKINGGVLTPVTSNGVGIRNGNRNGNGIVARNGDGSRDSEKVNPLFTTLIDSNGSCK